VTYKEAEAYILGIPKFTSKNGLEHTRLFLSYLGEPLSRSRVIHVAGTNGKGSVCAYLNTLLLAQGKTAGLFISPHLIKMNERIQINGRQVTDEEFLDVFLFVKAKVDEMQKRGLPHPTFFEFLFGMAMEAFHRAGVEYIVLETGMGGRFDATNTIENPLAAVITSIGLDHTAILGDTVEKIAFEKAGIIKPGVPVFFADTQEESNRVIERTAKELGASCKKIGKDAYEILGIKDKYIAFSCANAYYGDTTWTLRNIGIYQPENALLALEVMRMLFGDKGCLSTWRDALARFCWEGRMEEVLPEVYVDGAHNISAVEGFVQSVPGDKRNIIVFSAVQDKDYEKMIAFLCRNLETDFYMVTPIKDKRAVSVQSLQRVFQKYTEKPVFARESLGEALTFVLERREGRRVFCLGSLYLTGMIKSLIKEAV